jgi:hypothetical protein
VALHDASESAPLGLPNYFQDVAGLEDVNADLLANFKLAYVIDLDFPKVAAIPLVFQVPGPGLVEAFSLAEAQLDCLVSIPLLGLDLSHNARSGFNHSDRNDSAVVPKHLSHSNFFPQKTLYHLEYPRSVGCVII